MTGSATIGRFHNTTAIEFGAGVLDRLPAIIERYGQSRVLLASDPGLVAAGVVDRVAGQLRECGLTVTIFTDLESEPDVRSIRAGIALAQEAEAGLVVGLGGGSALDAAKAIGVMLENPGDIKDYAGIDRIPLPGRPVIALPTTAGTGSEVTIWSVLSDKAADEKFAVGSQHILPRVALLDPQLTLSLPPRMTAATGMDALTHALESYVNLVAEPISELMAERAIALIGRSLRKAVADGGDVEGRGDMLLASTLAGMAFNNTRLGIVHAFAMPLGAMFPIPHGIVNAIMLPPVTRFNAPGNVAKFAKIAELLGEPSGLTPDEAAERAAGAVERLRRDIGLTDRLSDFGVNEERFEAIVEEAMKSGNIAVNPRVPSRADMRDMLAEAL